MIHQMVEIRAESCAEAAGLYTYFLDNSPEMRLDRRRPVVVICPGGGYEMTSDREGEALAVRFMAAGFHAAVLRYSVWPAVYPVSLLQLAKAVAYLRENSERYNLDPDKIIVQGSSAGGHLAASLGVFWNRGWLADRLSEEALRFKPNALLLCYPVITSGSKTHEGSMAHLLGEKLGELRGAMSLEEQVGADTPPAFLWHTATDDTVPVENSLLFFQALHNAGIPAELHIYPVGGHGLGLADEETSKADGYGVQEECQSWMGLAVSWIRHLF